MTSKQPRVNGSDMSSSHRERRVGHHQAPLPSMCILPLEGAYTTGVPPKLGSHQERGDVLRKQHLAHPEPDERRSRRQSNRKTTQTNSTYLDNILHGHFSGTPTEADISTCRPKTKGSDNPKGLVGGHAQAFTSWSRGDQHSTRLDPYIGTKL